MSKCTILCFVIFLGACSSRNFKHDITHQASLTPYELKDDSVYAARSAKFMDGRIVIADYAAMKLFFYENGKVVRSAGGRGRGPGEMTSIIWVNKIADQIYVWDQGSQKVMIYDDEGRLISSHILKGVASPASFLKPNNNQFVVIHPDLKPEISENSLIQLYDSTFSYSGNSYLKIKDLGYDDPIIQRVLRVTSFGNTSDQNRIIYAPIIYNGELFELRKTGKEWTTSVKGKPRFSEPYRITNGSTESFDINLKGNSNLSYRSSSQGMHFVKDKLYHFIWTKNDGYREFGVEIFNDDLELIGYAPIAKADVSQKYPWVVTDMNNDLQFLLIKTDDKENQVWVGELKKNR